MNGTEAVAADTNLLGHPAPRRYLTDPEELRGRRVAILSMVDSEPGRELYSQAVGHIQNMCRQAGVRRAEDARAATEAAASAVVEWWDGEPVRNSSAYTHMPDLGGVHYRSVVADLQAAAFTDSRDSDLCIYAQAWAHGVDVLAGRNRRTIRRENLKTHSARRGYPNPPVMVRGLYEHTSIIAESEGRSVSDVAFEAVLGAVIPEAWTPDISSNVPSSCESFANSLATADGRSMPGVLGESELVYSLNETIYEIDEASFVLRCREAHANRPTVARETEDRSHKGTHAAVRERIEIRRNT